MVPAGVEAKFKDMVLFCLPEVCHRVRLTLSQPGDEVAGNASNDAQNGKRRNVALAADGGLPCETANHDCIGLFRRRLVPFDLPNRHRLASP